jgi:hypothetical protein
MISSKSQAPKIKQITKPKLQTGTKTALVLDSIV